MLQTRLLVGFHGIPEVLGAGACPSLDLTSMR